MGLEQEDLWLDMIAWTSTSFDMNWLHRRMIYIDGMTLTSAACRSMLPT